MAQYNPKIDIVFRKLFGGEGSKSILLPLINAVVEPYPRFADLVIKNPYSPTEYFNPKRSFVDVMAVNADGISCDIEIEVGDHRFHGNGMASNLERLFADEPTATGLQFHKADKIGMRITDFDLYADDRYCRHYVHKDQATDATGTGLDFQHYYILEMPNFKKSVDELSSPLDRWMLFLNRGGNWNPDDMPDALKPHSDIAAAVEKLITMWLNNRESETYEGQLRVRLDRQARLWTAHQNGFEEGPDNLSKKLQQV